MIVLVCVSKIMDLNQSTGNRMPSQEHLNFINKLNDAKIPRQSQLIANRLFMKNFPRDVSRRRSIDRSIEYFFIYGFSFRQRGQKSKVVSNHLVKYMISKSSSKKIRMFDRSNDFLREEKKTFDF